MVDRFGQELEATATYRIVYTFSEQVLAYSYAVQNLTNKTYEFTLDFSSSINMLCSSKKNKITKIIGGGQTEFMMHTMSKPSVTNYKRGVKCTF